MKELMAIAERRALPCMVAGDDGIKLAGQWFAAGSQDTAVEWHYIAQGKPDY